MPPDLLAELIAAGLFRMLTPRSHGGMEIDFPTSMEIIETIAAADGATGWTVMIGSETPQLLALLPRHRFDQLYADGPDLIVGGGFAPRGQAELRGGEYIVNGRWAFASGCQHAKWLIGNCIVTENGKPRAGFIPGSPEIRAMMFAPESAKIIDTWSVNGLRGTGSHDIEVRDLRVPAEDTHRYFLRPLLDPGSAVRGASRVLCFAYRGGRIGNRKSRGARDRRVRCDQQEKASLQFLDDGGYAAVPISRRQCGNDAACRTGSIDGRIKEGLENAVAGKSLIPNEQIRVVGTAAWVAHTAASIVDACYTAGGGTSLYDSSPLQRCLRDIHTLTQHAAVAEDSITRAGAVLLGRESAFPSRTARTRLRDLARKSSRRGLAGRANHRTDRQLRRD